MQSVNATNPNGLNDDVSSNNGDVSTFLTGNEGIALAQISRSVEDVSSLISYDPDSQTRTLQGHVLVVDDEPASARVLEAKLRSAGHRVTVVHAPSEAQKLVLAEAPDVIVTDVCMPEMDGIELTGWLRAQEQTANVPVLLLTSIDDI